MLNSLKSIFGIILTCFVASLVGCSGGSSTNDKSTASLPSSGTYSYTLKVQGTVSSPTFGLSLVHPNAPGVEYVIEPATSVIRDLKVVSSGTVNVSTATVSNIQPYALLYIVGGDVRRLPLAANGSAPITQVKKSGNTKACKFVIDANDYATPDNSRFIVSTAGGDGQCGTADDEQAEVTLTSGGDVQFNQRFGVDAIGMLRDPDTLAPNAWILGNGIYFWTPTSLVILRMNSDPPYTRAVSQALTAAVVESNNRLTVLKYQAPNTLTTVSSIRIELDPVITAGSGWQSIGFDNSNFYVYRNSGTTTSSNWSVLKISRSAPTATKLASGTGLIQASSMGTNLLYVTVVGASNNSLLTIDKTTPGVPKVYESTATSQLSTVLTSNSGVHQLWQITGINSSSPSYTIKMIDELGSILYTASGGFPLAMPDAATLNLNVSENRSRFVFATGYGTRAFGDASLIAYDAASKVATSLGTLPGTTEFGSKPVYATITTTSTDFMSGFVTTISSGTLQSDGAKVLSVNSTTANSLTFTTSTQ